MRKDNFNIKIEYKPFSAYKNVLVLSGSNRQNYNANTRFFEPDRRIDPYVVLVQCGVNDIHGLVTGLVNANLTDVSWKMSSSTGYKEIETTNNEFRIGTGADKGKLTVFKNVSDIEAVTILFTARFYHAATKRTVNFQESFNLVTLPVAQAPVLLETSAPVGFNLYPTENDQGLLCQADLYQGADKLPAAYWWYKGTTLLTDTNGYQGTAKNKLFVPSSQISKTGDVFKCEVADCSEYFNELVLQKVEADAKVMEWRNLYQTETENMFSMNTIRGSFSFEEKIIVFKSADYNGIDLCGNEGRYEAGSHVINGFVRDITGVNSRFVVRYSDGSASGGIYNAHLPYTTDSSKTVEKIVLAYTSTGNVEIKELKIYKKEGEVGLWSPSKSDLQYLIEEKTAHYKSETSLPENYRPSPKPTKLYKGDFMLMKKYPQYEIDVLYPTTVSPEATSVQVEMVLTTNTGVIQNPELYFSVGWIKNTDGTFKYKGFKVNISIADIQALNTANKQLDYELREDLTLKV